MGRILDRVKETSTTTGTGTLTLAGAATGYRTFTSVFSNLERVEYAMTDGTDWEVGEGVFTTSGTTLSRSIIRASSNSNNAVNWGAGTREVWCNAPAASISTHRRNAIIGGDFSTNPWQRGVSQASVSNGLYVADRWIHSKVGVMVHTLSKSADAPTVAQAGRLTNHCLLMDCTTVDAAIASTDFCLIGQRIEGYNWMQLAQRDITLQFWHKHTKTGTYCVALTNSGNDRSYVAEYTQAVTDTWEYTAITITASPSAGTWDYTTGIGVQVSFAITAGSNFHTTANAWQTGQFYATSSQVNASDNTANNFRIALVQLEVGRLASDFEFRTYEDELELCQRYCWLTYLPGIYPAASATAGAIGSNAVGTTAGAMTMTVKYPVSMRAAPSIVFYSTDGTAANWRRNAGAANVAMVIPSSAASGVESTLVANNGAITDNELVFGHIHATAEL